MFESRYMVKKVLVANVSHFFNLIAKIALSYCRLSEPTIYETITSDDKVKYYDHK